MTRAQRLILLALAVLLTLAALGPIRNYDLFWHLATGRWIDEHRALPATDPFAVASDRTPWINGEWLFEVLLHRAESRIGLGGLSVLRALLIACVFALAFRYRAPDAEEGLLIAIAFAGAMQTIDLRPSGVAALFLVLAISAAYARRIVLYILLTILWINIHPSALLAPAIAFVIRPKSWWLWLSSGAALLVNPHGIDGVLAPLRLLSFVQSGAFVNAEWLPSAPALFPLLYATIAVAVAAVGGQALLPVLRRQRREDESDRQECLSSTLWRIVLLAMFAILAVRHVRNQPLWYAAFALLTPMRLRIPRAVAYAASIAVIAWVGLRGDRTLGVSPSRFPLEAATWLKATSLPGNIYNPDQFGGVVIHTFYPERRALTDGRNELYHAFIPEYARARSDERAWRALLRKYEIDLAIDEYRRPLRVQDAVTGEVTESPASLAYWPRDEWALIGYDKAAMLFARRAAFSKHELENWEVRGVVPDAIPRR